MWINHVNQLNKLAKEHCIKGGINLPDMAWKLFKYIKHTVSPDIFKLLVEIGLDFGLGQVVCEPIRK